MKNKSFFVVALVGFVGILLGTKFLLPAGKDEIETKKTLARVAPSILQTTTAISTKTRLSSKEKGIDKHEAPQVVDGRKARIAEAIEGAHSEDGNHRVISIQTLVAESPQDDTTAI